MQEQHCEWQTVKIVFCTAAAAAVAASAATLCYGRQTMLGKQETPQILTRFKYSNFCESAEKKEKWQGGKVSSQHQTRQ